LTECNTFSKTALTIPEGGEGTREVKW